VPNNGDPGSTDGSSQEANILLKFFSSILPHFPAATGKVNSQVEELAHKFFEEKPKAIALQVANYFLRILHLANQQIEYPNGKVFQFGASKRSRRDLEYFFNNLEKVQSEVHDNAVAANGYVANAASFWNRSLAWLLARLLALTPEDARTDIEEVFAHEMAVAEEEKRTAAVEKEAQRQAQEHCAKEEELKREADLQREEEECRASLDGEVAKMPPAKAIQVIERWRRQLDYNLNGTYSRDVEVAFEVLRRGGNEFPFLKSRNTVAVGLRRSFLPPSKQTEAEYLEELRRFRALTEERPSKKDLLLSGEAGDAQPTAS